MFLIPDEHAGLAPTAVAGDPLVGGQLGNIAPALRARLTALIVDFQEVPDFYVYFVTHALPEHPDGILNNLGTGIVQTV